MAQRKIVNCTPCEVKRYQKQSTLAQRFVSNHRSPAKSYDIHGYSFLMYFWVKRYGKSCGKVPSAPKVIVPDGSPGPLIL